MASAATAARSAVLGVLELSGAWVPRRVVLRGAMLAIYADTDNADIAAPPLHAVALTAAGAGNAAAATATAAAAVVGAYYEQPVATGAAAFAPPTLRATAFTVTANAAWFAFEAGSVDARDAWVADLSAVIKTANAAVEPPAAQQLQPQQTQQTQQPAYTYVPSQFVAQAPLQFQLFAPQPPNQGPAANSQVPWAQVPYVPPPQAQQQFAPAQPAPPQQNMHFAPAQPAPAQQNIHFAPAHSAQGAQPAPPQPNMPFAPAQPAQQQLVQFPPAVSNAQALYLYDDAVATNATDEDTLVPPPPPPTVDELERADQRLKPVMAVLGALQTLLWFPIGVVFLLAYRQPNAGRWYLALGMTFFVLAFAGASCLLALTYTNTALWTPDPILVCYNYNGLYLGVAYDM